MRRGLLVLLAPLVFSAAVTAQTQVIDSGVAGDRMVVPNKAEAVIARLTPDEVVSRLLTFDRDRDGKVAESELAERMQPLMARGDSNRDGALDATELRALATAPPAPAPQGRIGGPFGYGFADEESFSSRNHIEGAIEDLKLTADAREQALSIAKAFIDSVEADAQAVLVEELSGLLSVEQLNRLQQMLKTPGRRTVSIKTPNGTETRTVVLTFNPLNQIKQFAFERNGRAARAVDRYVARVTMGEGERMALVDQLKGVLNAEERDNLRAALARRPVVATNHGVLIASLRAELNRLAGGSAGVAHQISIETQSLTPVPQGR